MDASEKFPQQKGVNDCGIFAVAFATTLCTGFDPTDLQYDQNAFRDGLYSKEIHHTNSVYNADKETSTIKLYQYTTHVGNLKRGKWPNVTNVNNGTMKNV